MHYPDTFIGFRGQARSLNSKLTCGLDATHITWSPQCLQIFTVTFKQRELISSSLSVTLWFEHLYLRLEEWFMSISLAKRWQTYPWSTLHSLQRGFWRLCIELLLPTWHKFCGVYRRKIKEWFLVLRHLLVYSTSVWLTSIKICSHTYLSKGGILWGPGQVYWWTARGKQRAFYWDSCVHEMHSVLCCKRA